MKHFFAVLGLVLALLAPPAALAGRTPRSDNPGKLCDMQHWQTLGGGDPYLPIDGNSDAQRDLPTFFIPGTVTTGDKIVACQPILPLSQVWAADPEQAPNPASKPDPETGLPTIPAMEAKNAVMYEWVNEGASPPLDFALPPDVEVIVWTLKASNSLPGGAFEIELDNWCGYAPFADFTDGPQEPPNANSSFVWNGNEYTASCASFSSPDSTSATDLLLNGSGVLIGYIDASNTRHLAAKAPGWGVSLFTATALALLPNPVTSGTPVKVQGAVAALPGASIPTGNVTFYNGTSVIGTNSLNPAGVASVTTSLSTGTYSISAAYAGDATHAASTSVTKLLTVQ
jgi:hypothetical protein